MVESSGANRHQISTTADVRARRMAAQLLPGWPIVGGEQLQPFALHANSLVNEMACVRNRIVMEVPRPTARRMARIRHVAMELADAWTHEMGMPEQWTTAQAVKHMVARHGAKLYGPAGESLGARPLTKLDMKVSMFLKAEKWQLPLTEQLKTPRAIQYRGPRYNILLAKFLGPVEAKLYPLLSGGRSITRVHSSKGLSPNNRSVLVEKLWRRHSRPTALCLDSSRFDAHVSEEALMIEHSIYGRMYSQNRLLAWMLRGQRRNRGTGVWGTKYRVRGCRMSGDVNTALGNTVLNASILKSCCPDGVDILVEGDDAVLFGSREEILALARTIPGDLLDAGFEVRVGVVAYSVPEIQYCSSRTLPSEAGHGALSVRDWPKPIVTDCFTVRPVEGVPAMEKALTMAVCFGYLYRATPVYQAWASYLLSWCSREALSGRRLLPLSKHDPELYARALLAKVDDVGEVVSLGSRAEFAIAFGIVPSEQLAIEGALVAAAGPFPPRWEGVANGLAGL